jgi:hypothetical protein
MFKPNTTARHELKPTHDKLVSSLIRIFGLACRPQVHETETQAGQIYDVKVEPEDMSGIRFWETFQVGMADYSYAQP